MELLYKSCRNDRLIVFYHTRDNEEHIFGLCYFVRPVILNICMHYHTFKVWSFRDTGSFHCPVPRFISRGATQGNKHWQGAMETACIPK